MSELLQSFYETPFFQFLAQHNLLLLTPELIILVGFLFCIFHAFGKSEKDRNEAWGLSVFSVVMALTSLLIQFFNLYQTGALTQFSVYYNLLQADLFSWIVRTLMVVGTGLVLLMAKSDIGRKSSLAAEFYLLLLAALLGGMVAASASDLIMLFVGLETLGISSYILAGFLRGNVQSGEAALKYLLYGGASTAVLLFGFSLLFGLAGGHTQYGEMVTQLTRLTPSFSFIVPVSVMMILAGFAFKLSAAPFHMWSPDVYEGAPTPVTAFLSVVSKIAGFAILIRFLVTVIGVNESWFGLIATMALVSMVVGNTVALTQTRLKRLLAYSTVAHAGYMLVGLLTLSVNGISSLLFYLASYLAMNLGAFAVVMQLERELGTDEIPVLGGLVRKRPVLTLMASFFLLSLAGIPITVGFFAKFFLFQSVATVSPQFLWLILVALFASTVSLYYYLNVIRVMVVSEPTDSVNQLLPRPLMQPAFSLALTVCFFLTLFLGFWASPALQLTQQSVVQLSQQAQFLSAKR
jgi:NAD(P)H-quinone oxidoreductase subunit 2